MNDFHAVSQQFASRTAGTSSDCGQSSGANKPEACEIFGQQPSLLMTRTKGKHMHKRMQGFRGSGHTPCRHLLLDIDFLRQRSALIIMIPAHEPLSEFTCFLKRGGPWGRSRLGMQDLGTDCRSHAHG